MVGKSNKNPITIRAIMKGKINFATSGAIGGGREIERNWRTLSGRFRKSNILVCGAVLMLPGVLELGGKM